MTWAVGWFLIARFHPWSPLPVVSKLTHQLQPRAELAHSNRLGADAFWDNASTAIECALLQGIMFAIWRVRLRTQPNASKWSGRFLLSAPTLVFCVDLWLFSLTGIHLFSDQSIALLQSVPTGIVGFVSPGVVITVFGLAAAWSAVFALAYLGERVSRLWERPWHTRYLAYGSILTCMVFLVFNLLVPGLGRTHATLVHYQPTRHPIVAFGFMRRDSTPELLPTRAPGITNHDSLAKQITALPKATEARMQAMRMNVVIDPSVNERSLASSKQYPDILLIIGESLRPQLLTEEVMPHAFGLTRKGIWLRQHYSGGNASSLGVFSIVSGLEAVWFYKSDVRFAPAMNRLFRQAGYELGFFASTNDWSTFQMDAFLSDRHYDVFQSNDFTGLDADQRAITAASKYLDARSPRPPRLAVLCLYGTHAPFWCDEEFAIDQPAAGPSYPIPFADSWRPRVWNRYRNAARTLDASIAELVKPALDDGAAGSTRPRIVLLTGDHGESFGEDGTIGHGTRLSVAQTQTLAVLAGRGVPHVTWDRPTQHADCLPTLLSVAGISTSLPSQFDGRVLTDLDEMHSGPAVPATPFSIAGYAGKQIAIISESVPPTWAVKCRFSLMDYQTEVEYAIGADGAPAINPTQEVGHSHSPLPSYSQVLEGWLRRLNRSPEPRHSAVFYLE